MELRFRVGDQRSTVLRVAVIIHDATGNVVRRLEAAPVTVVPGGPLVNGNVAWDGRDSTLTALVPAGAYYYRVVVVDEAGHMAHSGESTRLTVRLL